VRNIAVSSALGSTGRARVRVAKRSNELPAATRSARSHVCRAEFRSTTTSPANRWTANTLESGLVETSRSHLDGGLGSSSIRGAYRRLELASDLKNARFTRASDSRASSFWRHAVTRHEHTTNTRIPLPAETSRLRIREAAAIYAKATAGPPDRAKLMELMHRNGISPVSPTPAR
jgi:hypothetical protein